MKRENFLMAAALRLITAKPDESMSRIAFMANELTSQIFDTIQPRENDGVMWWSDEADKAPIHILLSHIEQGDWNTTGYRVRLTRIFKNSNINTVGDLLRIGRSTFKNFHEVGMGSVFKIDDALHELYKIQDW